MVWELIGLPIGIILLYFGSEWMVDGAKKMAFRLKVAPFVVGLTVVAFGSSAPETITGLVSSSNPQIIIGNIVGSNIANVGLAIGLAAVITPIACNYKSIRFELFAMMAAVILLALLALQGSVGILEGIVLLAALCAFLYGIYRFKRGHPGESSCDAELEEEAVGTATPLWKCIVMIIVGIVALYIGAKSFIAGSIELAHMAGVSDLLIGLIVVAVGSSLPELCICILAAYRKENELVVSNIVGSIMFNTLFALGVAIMFTTVPILHYVLVFHIPVMVLLCALMLHMVRRDDDIHRSEGAVLLGIYAIYVALMIAFPQLTSGIV